MKVFIVTYTLENCGAVSGAFTDKKKAIEWLVGLVLDLIDDSDGGDDSEYVQTARETADMFRNGEEDDCGVMLDTPNGEAWVNIYEEELNKPGQRK